MFGLDGELVDAPAAPRDDDGGGVVDAPPQPWGCTPALVAVGGPTGDVAVADFDNVGGPDLVATKASTDQLVFVPIADGRQFGSVTNVASSGGPSAIAIGDLDGDPNPDLVTVNGAKARVYLGNGMTAGETTSVTLPTLANELVLAPIDGTAGDDLVVSLRSTGSVSTYVNGGSGAFATTGIGYPVTQPVALVAGAFDAAPAIDLVALSFGANGADGAIVGLEATPQLTGVAFPRVMAAGELVGDEALDVVVATDLNEVIVFEGLGNGLFVPGPMITLSESIFAIAVGRLDGDPQPDIVVVTPDQVRVLRIDNGGLMTAPVATVPGASSVQLADLDRDDHMDIIVTSKTSDAITVLWCQ